MWRGFEVHTGAVNLIVFASSCLIRAWQSMQTQVTSVLLSSALVADALGETSSKAEAIHNAHWIRAS